MNDNAETERNVRMFPALMLNYNFQIKINHNGLTNRSLLDNVADGKRRGKEVFKSNSDEFMSINVAFAFN